MRPGGLTALAVFNFIFGGLAALINMIGLATVELQLKNFEQAAKITGDPVPGAGLLYLVGSLALIRAGLLIWSGVGYIGLKRFSGRILGNAYAVLAFIGILIEVTAMPHFFTITSLIDFVYPLITLFLLNVIFRRDLVR